MEIKLISEITTLQKITKRYTIQVRGLSIELWKTTLESEDQVDSDWGWEAETDKMKYHALEEEEREQVRDFIEELN